MRFSTSGWLVTPNRSSSLSDREPIRKCTWASLKAGMIVPPPASMYRDPAVLEKAEDRIFARTWQLVAHVNELARPGDFKPTTIIDEPILLTRAQDGTLHGFYNVCRHRAAQVVTTRGNRKSLQ